MNEYIARQTRSLLGPSRVLGFRVRLALRIHEPLGIVPPDTRSTVCQPRQPADLTHEQPGRGIFVANGAPGNSWLVWALTHEVPEVPHFFPCAMR